jgi:hypothetical protein
VSARHRERSYQSLYGITRQGKVNIDKGVNKVGKRLGHGLEMRIINPDHDIRVKKKH